MGKHIVLFIGLALSFLACELRKEEAPSRTQQLEGPGSTGGSVMMCVCYCKDAFGEILGGADIEEAPVPSGPVCFAEVLNCYEGSQEECGTTRSKVECPVPEGEECADQMAGANTPAACHWVMSEDPLVNTGCFIGLIHLDDVIACQEAPPPSCDEFEDFLNQRPCSGWYELGGPSVEGSYECEVVQQ